MNNQNKQQVSEELSQIINCVFKMLGLDPDHCDVTASGNAVIIQEHEQTVEEKEDKLTEPLGCEACDMCRSEIRTEATDMGDKELLCYLDIFVDEAKKRFDIK